MESGCRHADGDELYSCQKYEITMCRACLKCRDPHIYCKFRSSCTAHFLTRRSRDLDRDSGRIVTRRPKTRL